VLLACRDLKISAVQIAGGSETYDIDIEAGKVSQLLTLFGGDLVQVANYLKLQENRMILMNPKYDRKQKQQRPADSEDCNSDDGGDADKVDKKDQK
jgi:hypothetical protein